MNHQSRYMVSYRTWKRDDNVFFEKREPEIFHELESLPTTKKKHAANLTIPRLERFRSRVDDALSTIPIAHSYAPISSPKRARMSRKYPFLSYFSNSKNFSKKQFFEIFLSSPQICRYQ